MQFNPNSEETMEYKPLLPGVYPYRVVGADEKLSKAGNEMLVLKLEVLDFQGKLHTLTDYLVSSVTFRIKNFCEANQLEAAFQRGNISCFECIGKSGNVELDIMKGASKGNGEFYSDRNVIKKYHPMDEQTKKAFAFDDDIPF